MGSNTDLRQVTETWESQMRVTQTLGGGRGVTDPWQRGPGIQESLSTSGLL